MRKWKINRRTETVYRTWEILSQDVPLFLIFAAPALAGLISLYMQGDL